MHSSNTKLTIKVSKSSKLLKLTFARDIIRIYINEEINKKCNILLLISNVYNIYLVYTTQY